MRKLFFIVVFSFVLMTCFGQIRTKSPELDFNFGTENSLGFAFKNFNGWGFYLEFYGSGSTVVTGSSGVDYSSIADNTVLLNESILDIVDKNAITAGIMINSEKIFNAGRRLNFILGVGSMTEITYEKSDYRYDFEYSETEFSHWTAEHTNESKVVFDIGLNVNVIQIGPLVIGAETVYNTGLGLDLRGFAGLKFRED